MTLGLLLRIKGWLPSGLATLVQFGIDRVVNLISLFVVGLVGRSVEQSRLIVGVLVALVIVVAILGCFPLGLLLKARDITTMELVRRRE